MELELQGLRDSLTKLKELHERLKFLLKEIEELE